MSPRSGMPAARNSRSHYFVTFSRGDAMKCFALPPWTLFGVVLVAPILLCAYLGATYYLFYRDDLVAGLMARQNDMRFAYEERLASMRTQLDHATGRQLLDQNTLEGRVHELLSRQAQVENRAAIIQALARQSSTAADTTASIPGVSDQKQASRPSDARGALNKAFGATGPVQRLGAPATALPAGATAFAPLNPVTPAGEAAKPRPEAPELHGSLSDPRDPVTRLLTDTNAPVEQRLGALDGSLDRVEIAEVGAVAAVGERARKSAARLRAALRSAGVPIEKIGNTQAVAKDIGGPFVPLKADPKGSLFEQEVYRLQNDFADSAVLRGVARRAPVRQPLDGPLVVTSPFGARVDPFFGRMATHTGVDLREATGAPIHATAAGKITIAGWTGGYGNMVEIDHGNGMSTRYGHMSAINVEVGQTVEARDIIGRVGSTGRSTGSHLHYEVRVDGEPVDPMRFLNAGLTLAAAD